MNPASPLSSAEAMRAACVKFHDDAVAYHANLRLSYRQHADDPDEVAAFRFHTRKIEFHRSSAAAIRCLTEPEGRADA